MKLHSDWRYLLRCSWTIKWQAVGALLDTVQIVLPLFSDRFRPAPFAGVLLAVSLAGIGARLLRQPKDGL